MLVVTVNVMLMILTIAWNAILKTIQCICVRVLLCKVYVCSRNVISRRLIGI